MASVRNAVALAVLSLAVVAAACSDSPVAPAPAPTAAPTIGSLRTRARHAGDRRPLRSSQSPAQCRGDVTQWKVDGSPSRCVSS